MQHAMIGMVSVESSQKAKLICDSKWLAQFKFFEIFRNLSAQVFLYYWTKKALARLYAGRRHIDERV
jgi:hypothetical protein